VLEALRADGLRIGIVSNLAAPYAEPLLQLLPFAPDAHAWSFEVGHLKPDPCIFSWICDRLDVAAIEALLMVGDTFADDYEGALASGLNALQLDRRGSIGQSKAVATIQTLERFFQRSAFSRIPGQRARRDRSSRRNAQPSPMPLSRSR
jgi:FMN phosphatase YigB (HAD superfamily)